MQRCFTFSLFYYLIASWVLTNPKKKKKRRASQDRASQDRVVCNYLVK